MRRDIADEIILVPIRQNIADLQTIFSLDAVGDYIWLQLDGQKTCGDIHTSLLAAFEVEADQAAEDLEGFIGDLLKANLIGEAVA